MKKPLIIIFCVCMTFTLTAQEQSKQKEVGLVLKNLDNFGLSFKKGTKNSLWRLNTLVSWGYNRYDDQDTIVYKSNQKGFTLKFGKEFRKTIVENLEFRFGADISFSYSRYKSDNNDKTISDFDYTFKRMNYKTGLNLVLGLNYVIKDKFVIGAELLPGVSYFYEVTKNKFNNNDEIKEDNSGINYGFSNSDVLISFSYRF